MNTLIISATIIFFAIGTVESIKDGIAHVVFTTAAPCDPEREGPVTYEADMPVAVFPCEISQNDTFHIRSSDGVTELRCGESE